MKKFLFIPLVCFVISCAPAPGPHPDFAKNVETAKSLFKLQGTEADLDKQVALAHPDLEWQAAFHGAGLLNKEAYGPYLKAWHDLMDDVVFTPVNWLPGVSADTGLPDGSVRTYGKWTGNHTETGKSWELISYHTFDFQDGLIIAGGDYFDAGGLIASLQVEDLDDQGHGEDHE